MATKPDDKHDILDSSRVSAELLDAFAQQTAANPERTLLRSHAIIKLEKWCSAGAQQYHAERTMHWWDATKGPKQLKELPIFDQRLAIVNKMKEYDVTILLGPTGIGKTVGASMLFCGLLKESENDVNRDKAESWRGMCVLPNTENVKSVARHVEKLMMTKKECFCEISTFSSPFEQDDQMLHRPDARRSLNEVRKQVLKKTIPPEFAISNHRALMALGRDTHLKMLIIDEFHSTKPAIALLITRARDLMYEKKLGKLVLSTATLSEAEIDKLTSYFAEKQLTLGVIDLHPELQSKKKFTMSCVLTRDEPTPDGFERTAMSKQFATDFYQGRVYNPNQERDSLREPKRHPFGSEECQIVPEMNNLMPYMKQALHRTMEEAQKWHEEGRLGDLMPSILVIIPGKEHADRMRSSVEKALFVDKGSPYFAPFKYKTSPKGQVPAEYKGNPAFLLKRLKSKKQYTEEEQKEAEEDDYILVHPLPLAQRVVFSCGVLKRLESKEKQERENKLKELRNPDGSWGGKKGNIIFATPQAAEGMTLKDVAFVIDAGVMRIAAPYSITGLRSLELTWVDRRMLLQRAGRCGRTNEGQYFLCVRGSKAARILRDDFKEKLLLREFDEQAWFRAMMMGCFDELFWTPPTWLTDMFKKSFMIRGLWTWGEFSSEAKLLYQYFPFLSPEIARFVVTGVRLGLAAHVICYVAEATVSHRLCGRPTKINSNIYTISDDVVYETFVNVSARTFVQGEKEPVRPYCMGDSVAIADLVTTWLRHTFPTSNANEDPECEPKYDKYVKYTAEDWIKMEDKAAAAPDGRFWAGRWCIEREDEENRDKKGHPIGMKKFLEVVVRDEGRDAVVERVHQITRACQRLGIIFAKELSDGSDRGSILSPRFNRYLRGDDNYNLNDEGRSLFRALLSMNSDKLASAFTHYFAIYREEHGGCMLLFEPERADWHQRTIGKEEKERCTKYGRYWSAFKATHAKVHKGMVDPITAEQVAFFLNFNGRIEAVEGVGLKIFLNASPQGYTGTTATFMLIKMDSGQIERVKMVRNSLKRATSKLLREKTDETFNIDDIGSIADSIIRLWNALDNGYEKEIPMMDKWDETCKLMDLVEGAVAGDRVLHDFLPARHTWGSSYRGGW